MKREVHSRELQLMDAVRRRYMENQNRIKEVELKRMDDEIQRKVRDLYSLLFFMYGYKPCIFLPRFTPSHRCKRANY